MAEGSRTELAKCLKLIIGVIYSTYKSKLIRRSSTGPLGIFGHGGVEVCQAPTLGTRHKGVSSSLDRRVERHGERELFWLACEPGYSGQHAAGRDG